MGITAAHSLAELFAAGEAAQASLVGGEAGGPIRLKEVVPPAGLLQQLSRGQPCYLHHTLHLLRLVLACSHRKVSLSNKDKSLNR